MDQYDGSASDKSTITLPNDIDVADSESVNTAFRAVRDSSRLSLSVHSESPIHQRVRLSSADTSTIQSQAVGGYMQQAQPFVPYSYLRGFRAADVFTVLDLDTPAPTVFEPSRIYYCYNVWDRVTNSFKKRISTEFPDETISVQKTDNFAHYLGAFVTDSGRRPIPFVKSACYYTFDYPGIFLLNPTTSTLVTYDLTPIIPRYCTRVRLRLNMFNLTATPDFCRVSAGGLEQPIPMHVSSNSLNYIDVVLRSNIVSARLSLGAVAAPSNQALIYLDGMWES